MAKDYSISEIRRLLKVPPKSDAENILRSQIDQLVGGIQEVDKADRRGVLQTDLRDSVDKQAKLSKQLAEELCRQPGVLEATLETVGFDDDERKSIRSNQINAARTLLYLLPYLEKASEALKERSPGPQSLAASLHGSPKELVALETCFLMDFYGMDPGHRGHKSVAEGIATQLCALVFDRDATGNKSEGIRACVKRARADWRTLEKGGEPKRKAAPKFLGLTDRNARLTRMSDEEFDLYIQRLKSPDD